ERDGVATNELDVAPTVLLDAAPRLLEHALRAIDADDSSALADAPHEHRQIPARAAADIHDRSSVDVTDGTDDALAQALDVEQPPEHDIHEPVVMPGRRIVLPDH